MTGLIGTVGNETLVGTGGNDTVTGKGGADTISGGIGDDVLYGDSKTGGLKTPAGVGITQDVQAKVTFITESAGHKNTLGIYVINEDGSITDVRILFANASLKGSGGDLVSKVSSVMAELKAGQRVGFFIAPDGFSKSGAVLSDTGATFELRNSAGDLARVADGADLVLQSISKDGVRTNVATANTNTLFFTDKSMNADGIEHVRMKVDAVSGLIEIGFEDLLGGGDRDFDDVVFTVDVGAQNASTWRAVDPPKVLANNNDELKAGAGNDQAHGGAGNDRIWGEAGDDLLDGGSGNDSLWGGTGNDRLFGRSGDDALYGEDGNDYIEGGAGNDRIWDGAGVDTVLGGSGRDIIWVGAGNDSYNGGSGHDIIDFSNAKAALNLDLSKKTAVSDLGTDTLESFEQVVGTRFNDTMRGSKDANTLIGGDGDDWFRGLGGADVFTGGKGKDTIAISPKDAWFEGEHLGIDRVTDFTLGEDKLDIFEITKNFKGDKLSLVKVEQVGKDVHVSADLGTDNGGLQKLVILEGQDAAKLTAAMMDWLII
jgi:serralysin